MATKSNRAACAAQPVPLISEAARSGRRRGSASTITLALALVAALTTTGVVLVTHTGNSTAVQWVGAHLITIAPRNLGAVTVGMTLAQASAAAGEPIVEVGDGFGYPNAYSESGLAIQGVPVDCVRASVAPAMPAVQTPQGFQVGGTVTALKRLYGSRLRFMPAPASGYSPQPGYVVSFPNGNLAFIVSKGTVTAIVGGMKATPSTC